MARIFLIRHAESIANTQGVFQGQSYDTDLSPLGVLQSRALKTRFSGEKFTAVFTSPLRRTRKTASVLGQAVDEPALLETNHGAWEGKSKAEIQARWPDLYSQWLSAPSGVQFPAGESFVATADRVCTWFYKLATRSGTYAVITHSNVIQALITKVLDQDLDLIWNYPVQPTAVTLIESQSPAKIIYANDISHLKDLKSDLSLQAI